MSIAKNKSIHTLNLSGNDIEDAEAFFMELVIDMPYGMPYGMTYNYKIELGEWSDANARSFINAFYANKDNYSHKIIETDVWTVFEPTIGEFWEKVEKIHSGLERAEQNLKGGGMATSHRKKAIIDF